MTVQQLELAAALRDEGMAQVTEASTSDAVDRVDAAIRQWAASGRRFSLNDIRGEFPGVRPGLPGARVTAAARRGLICDTGGRVPSSLPSTHRKQLTVWVGAPC